MEHLDRQHTFEQRALRNVRTRVDNLQLERERPFLMARAKLECDARAK